jgi:hypothetical protein
MVLKVTKRVSVAGEQLTERMTSILIAHAPGERAYRIDESETLRALKARGLIRYNRGNRPSQSISTVRGRQVIAALLAHPSLEPV